MGYCSIKAKKNAPMFFHVSGFTLAFTNTSLKAGLAKMWNLGSLKISMMVAIGGFAILNALPAKAQQVILTPGGTMLQTMPTVSSPVVLPNSPVSAESGTTPEVAALPQYDILTPEQLTPGKMIFRGQQIEILAPNDPRIPEAMRSIVQPNSVWIFGEMMGPGMVVAYQRPLDYFLAPPQTSTPVSTWDGVIRAGAKVPTMIGDMVVLANDDPRIPEDLRGLDIGESRFWLIDARVLNPAVPSNLFKPYLTDGNFSFGGSISMTREELIATVQQEKANRTAQDFLDSRLVGQARREQLRLIISNPEIYSFHPSTWGKPVKDVVDAQGNVVLSKQEIINNRVATAQNQLNGEGAVYAVWTRFDQYEALGFIPDTIEQLDNSRISYPGNFDSAQFYRQLIAERNIVLQPLPNGLFSSELSNTIRAGLTPQPPVLRNRPEGIQGYTTQPPSFEWQSVSIQSSGATLSSSAATGIASSIAPTFSMTADATNTTRISEQFSQTPMIRSQVPVNANLPIVSVQASQNPTVDFASTRSFDRAPLPQQLNRQLAESPLSSSRIFPGMR
jgi:hypothetical protein